MNYCIIIGGHRKESQSGKVGQYIRNRVQTIEGSAEMIDLRENPLPLWNDEMWTGKGKLHDLWQPYKEKLNRSDALIVIVPEYNGMAAAGVKNFFLYVDKKSVAHKPALLVAVSAGTGGAYPIMEMRGSSYKNCRICYIPDHLILRNVENIFNQEEPENKSDEYLRKRADYSLKILRLYTENMRPIRSDSIVDLETYGNGM